MNAYRDSDDRASTGSLLMSGGLGYDWRIGNSLPHLGQHSAVKHRIFDRYIEVYIRTLTRTVRQRDIRLTIIDGFCGGGLYTLAGQEVDGSPLRMLASVERIELELAAQRINGFDIRADFVFVDSNPDHIDFLREALRNRGHYSRIGRDIHIVGSKFEAAAPGIIGRIQAKGTAHRSLFFLDQYGWSDVTFRTVRQIMATLKYPEIVLTFMVDNLVNLLNDGMIDTQGLAAIDLGREDIREMLAMKEQRGWKRLIQNTLYEHIQRNTGASFYTPFFIHPDSGSNRDYWLLHLSKHHTARDEMGKIHWELENTFEHFGRAGFNSLGFDPDKDVREGMLDFAFDDDARTRSEGAAIDFLDRMLHQRARDDLTPITKQELFAAHCNESPVTARILDAAVVQLREAGDVVVHSPEGGLHRSVKSFHWGVGISRSEQKDMFSILDRRAA